MSECNREVSKMRPWPTGAVMPKTKIVPNQDVVQLQTSCFEGRADFILTVTLYTQLSKIDISPLSLNTHESLQTETLLPSSSIYRIKLVARNLH
jgi:hypothetical protein